MLKINSPYFDERGERIDSIVIHCLAYDVDEALEVLNKQQVSAHFIINEKGKIYQLVDEQKRAWHAGQSFWDGKENLNHCSIGIELCSPSLGQEKYSFMQISALVRLCQRLKRKYHIKKERILGHSDIAPTRKPDPGKAFPWAYMARHGLGVWYDLKNAPKVQISDKRELLSKIGYDTTNPAAAEWAFIRHFMSDCVREDTIENLISKPYLDEIVVDEARLQQTLKAVYFEYRKV